MLGLKLNHVSKRGHWRPFHERFSHLNLNSNGKLYDFSIVIQIRWKFHSALIQVVVKWSLWNFAHGTTVVVTCATFCSDMIPNLRSPFHDLSFLENKYLVSVDDGRQSMCHNDGGLVLTDLSQRRLDVALCLCVQCWRRLKKVGTVRFRYSTVICVQ